MSLNRRGEAKLDDTFEGRRALERTAATFGYRLKSMRLERKWSQAHLAGLMGIHTSLIGRLECGVRWPHLGHLLRMQEAFGCTLDELVTYGGRS